MKTTFKSFAATVTCAAAMIAFSAMPSVAASNDHPEILMQTTKGPITFELYPKDAPITVANFIKLVKQHFYDGLMFHRVQDLGMPGSEHIAQGGDPTSRNAQPGDPNLGQGGSGTDIKGEFPANGVNNPLKHLAGALAMARSGDPNSASSQFYICTQPCPDLDGSYCVFGYVVKGLGNASKLVVGDRMTKVTIVHN